MRDDRTGVRTKTNYGRKDYYIDGNTVRRTEAAPGRDNAERQHRERMTRIEQERREAEERRRRRIARRNQERMLRMSRSYVAFLTMAVIVFGTFAGVYIKLQSDVTARMKHISSLESEIADIRADNDEAFKRINTSVDLDSIWNAAVTEYGMSYAREAQIVYYKVGDDDYMNQYGEIPGK